MTLPTSHNCPDDEVLQELAAGICLPELADQTMRHVARCTHCGAVLRRYVREFSNNVSPENVQIIKQLRSSTPQWQRDLVRQVIPQRHRLPWLKLAPACVALGLIVVGMVQGPALLSEFKLHQAQKQAVAGFEERRTIEMRLTSQGYSPPRPFPVVLGASESGHGLDEVPASLHDASGAANQNLRAPHADPRWLQVQGRVLLWESTPSSLEKAEKDFEKARAEGLDVPSLDIDLAVSYFERDSRSEHPNLQRTLNLLNQVLKNPRLTNQERATALYNLAIAYEKTQAWDLAATTWEDYLKLEPSGQWSEEALRRLKGAREKFPEKKQQGYSQPAFFLDQRARQSLKPEDPERYQQKAFSQWLPIALADESNEAYRALNGLAEVFAEHQDFWWKDFLAATGVSDLFAVRELSDALKNNEQGRYDEARPQAHHAGMTFAQHGNLPAQLLAGFAEVYAVRNQLKGEQCLMLLAPFLAKVSGTSYSWLHAQLLLETAQCRNFQVDLAESDNDANQSLAIADKAGLPVQKMRVFGISAGMKHQQGRCNESWTLSVEGLEQYWKGNYPGERLDQFYSVMWQCARETGSLFLAEALLRHTIAMREAPNTAIPQNPIRVGMLHLRLANILLALKEQDRAKEESKKAAALLPSDEIYIKDYILRAKIEPAELQLQQGDAVLALSTIQPVETLLQTVQDKFIELNFYRVLGNIYWEMRQLDKALTAYQSAIGLTEGSLANITDGPERLAWLRADDECYRGVVRVLLEQKKTSEALDRWEWYQGRPLLQNLNTGYGAIHPKAEARLDRDTGSVNTPVNVRLSYALFKDGLQTWVRNGSGVQGAWVELKQDDFERTTREFVEHCADPDSSLDDLQEQGAWLYSKLLQPIMPYLAESKTVTVELDRSFYNLPMEALRSPSGHYFGEQYWIAYSPGTQTEQRLRFPARIDRQAAVMVLDASRAPNSGYLPGIEAQRDVIQGIFPRTNNVDSMVITWPRLQQQLPAETIVHYMGHGKPDGSGTSLAFSKGRFLAAKDLTPGLFPRARLVVLAACSTGKGSENGLWDADNLVHAFLAAGVPQIVATHWNVDSSTTSTFMVSFYQNLGSGRTVVESAFAARKDILTHMPHPYYWAGFSVSGRVN